MPARWLLLHGTPMGAEVWDGVRPTLTSVHPVLAPQLGAPRSVIGAQGELAAAALDQAGDGELHVVGHSFGGQVAIEVALQAPERVRSLAIVCSRAAPFPGFTAAAANVRGGGPVDIDGALARWLTPDEIAAAGPVVEYVRGCLADVDRTLWADELDAIAGYDRMAALEQVAAPTSLVAAELDQVGTVDHMAAMAAAIPGADLVVRAGASHMSLFVDPGALAETLVAGAGRAG